MLNVQLILKLAKDSVYQIHHYLDYLYSRQQNPKYKYFYSNLFLCFRARAVFEPLGGFVSFRSPQKASGASHRGLGVS